jgi:hypothetical protein
MTLPFAKSALSFRCGPRTSEGDVPSGDGERVVSWSNDGLLVAEYALFDASDLVLRAIERTGSRGSRPGSGEAGGLPSTVVEAGYGTTARKALDRLARVGVTPALAEDVVRALSPKIASSLARCEAARAVANRLGAAELLDGARFVASIGVYQGAWIDLQRLCEALGVPAASVLLQAVHVAALLAEVPGSTPVFLSTAGALHGRRSDHRTYVRPAMPGVDVLLDALAKLERIDAADTTRESRFRPALLARIRERKSAGVPPAVSAHLEALEAAFLAGVPARSTAIVLHGSALPTLDRLGGIVSLAPERAERYVPEFVESLPLPDGVDESDLGDYVVPTTPLEARIAMTRLARDLAREYRLRDGKVLRCDALAIDTMQQYLLRWVGASLRDREVAWQLRRHGALLSEIFARVLGGAWIDLGHREAAYWMMKVRGDLRTRPIGCVFQFVAAGSRAADLVGHFMELQRRGREAAKLALGPPS